jgi:hypothetical protein
MLPTTTTSSSPPLNSAAVWEADADPDAEALPRPKRHDDKTLAAGPAIW